MGATQAPVEWISPGLSALFEALSGDRGYSILDLADHAGNSHLEVLGQFSRQIRFAGLAPSPPHGDAFASALLELPPGPCAYDIVLAWDVMDRLGPHERERLMDYLVEVTAPRAWLHAVVDSSGDESAPPLRFTLIDLDRVSRQAVGPPEPLAPRAGCPARNPRRGSSASSESRSDKGVHAYRRARRHECGRGVDQAGSGRHRGMQVLEIRGSCERGSERKVAIGSVSRNRPRISGLACTEALSTA